MSDQLPTLQSLPPGASQPLFKIRRFAGRPLERFLQIEAASGILLLITAALALAWANSPWAASYHAFWNLPVGISAGSLSLERSLQWIVNDGLMVIFFFVVGLEIRREIHRGELSEWRRASLPVMAAFGGMAVPALIYLAMAGDPATRSGWGVPMATDIAFAVGVLTILGKRVPAALRVLLLAVAVIDDLGAILVIAIFYSSGIAPAGLAVGAAGVIAILLMQRLGVRSKVAYIAPALVAWAGVYAAGVHPTIAGVIVGFLTPVTAWLGPAGFLQTIDGDLKVIETAKSGRVSQHKLAGILQHMDMARREVMSPSDALIEGLHPWVAFVIMPIFALANAGVSLGDVKFEGDSTTVAFAVALGLLLGKPIGILLLSWVSVKLRLAKFPAGISVRHIVVLGIVAGIGFTMALFVAQLAFADASHLAAAKLGVLAASGMAGVIGLALGWALLKTDVAAGAAQTADEAESSTEK
jgi:NhaA family Na+:H+ antiporter